MPCEPDLLKQVPLFSLLDEDERAVLSAHVEVRQYHPHQRIYKQGDAGGAGYVLVHGKVKVTLIDEDHQEVSLDKPEPGGFFGFASLLDGTAHQTSATALERATCLEIDRNDLSILLHKKPDAGMDMLAVLGRQYHAAQRLVQIRSRSNPNELIDEEATFGDRLADSVAKFGGSWRFIITFALVLIVYTVWNMILGNKAWDPYPFILLNLFLSMLASIQAPVIMMSQNRQDAKDRLRSELDFQVNRRAELEIRGLGKKLNELQDKIDGVEELLRNASRDAA